MKMSVALAWLLDSQARRLLPASSRQFAISLVDRPIDPGEQERRPPGRDIRYSLNCLLSIESLEGGSVGVI